MKQRIKYFIGILFLIITICSTIYYIINNYGKNISEISIESKELLIDGASYTTIYATDDESNIRYIDKVVDNDGNIVYQSIGKTFYGQYHELGDTVNTAFEAYPNWNEVDENDPYKWYVWCLTNIRDFPNRRVYCIEKKNGISTAGPSPTRLVQEINRLNRENNERYYHETREEASDKTFPSDRYQYLDYHTVESESYEHWECGSKHETAADDLAYIITEPTTYKDEAGEEVSVEKYVIASTRQAEELARQQQRLAEHVEEGYELFQTYYGQNTSTLDEEIEQNFEKYINISYSYWDGEDYEGTWYTSARNVLLNWDDECLEDYGDTKDWHNWDEYKWFKKYCEKYVREMSYEQYYEYYKYIKRNYFSNSEFVDYSKFENGEYKDKPIIAVIAETIYKDMAYATKASYWGVDPNSHIWQSYLACRHAYRTDGTGGFLPKYRQYDSELIRPAGVDPEEWEDHVKAVVNHMNFNTYKEYFDLMIGNGVEMYGTYAFEADGDDWIHGDYYYFGDRPIHGANATYYWNDTATTVYGEQSTRYYTFAAYTTENLWVIDPNYNPQDAEGIKPDDVAPQKDVTNDIAGYITNSEGAILYRFHAGENIGENTKQNAIWLRRGSDGISVDYQEITGAHTNQLYHNDTTAKNLLAEANAYAKYAENVRNESEDNMNGLTNMTDSSKLDIIPEDDDYMIIGPFSMKYIQGTYSAEYHYEDDPEYEGDVDVYDTYSTTTFAGISDMKIIGYNADGEKVNKDINIEAFLIDTTPDDNDITGIMYDADEIHYFTPNPVGFTDYAPQLYPGSEELFYIKYKNPNSNETSKSNMVESINIEVEFKWMQADATICRLRGGKDSVYLNVIKSEHDPEGHSHTVRKTTRY